MHDGKSHSQIDLAREIIDAQATGTADSGFNAAIESCLGCAFFQRTDHPLLHVDRNDPTIGSDQAGKWQGEESHGAADIQNRHSFTEKRPKNLFGILEEPP